MSEVHQPQPDDEKTRLPEKVKLRVAALVFVGQSSRGTVNSKKGKNGENKNDKPDRPVAFAILIEPGGMQC